MLCCSTGGQPANCPPSAFSLRAITAAAPTRGFTSPLAHAIVFVSWGECALEPCTVQRAALNMYLVRTCGCAHASGPAPHVPLPDLSTPPSNLVKRAIFGCLLQSGPALHPSLGGAAYVASRTSSNWLTRTCSRRSLACCRPRSRSGPRCPHPNLTAPQIMQRPMNHLPAPQQHLHPESWHLDASGMHATPQYLNLQLRRMTARAPGPHLLGRTRPWHNSNRWTHAPQVAVGRQTALEMLFGASLLGQAPQLL